MTRDGDAGFTLVELLVGMTISLVLLGATLTTFNRFQQSAHDADARNDTAELARRSLDVQARQLRNLAKRVSSPVIDTLSSYDLIFQTADPNRTWVRYCLDASAPQSTDNARILTGELVVASASVASPVTAAMRGACPGSGWTKTKIVADHVTNRRASLDRPLFTYTCTIGTACTTTPASYDQVGHIAARTIVDTTPDSGAQELSLTSAVNLRNQNQPPIATFVTSPSATRTVELNAAGSTDYEGRTMSYYWFKQAMPTNIDCAQPTVTGSGDARTLWGSGGYLGEGVSMTYEFPLGDGLGTRNIGLVVCDPGDRFDTAGVPPDATIAVQIPS